MRDLIKDRLSDCSSGSNGDDAQWTARASDNFERCGDYDGARRWKLVEIGKTCKSKFTAAMHQIVIRKRWIESGGLTSISPHRFYANTEDVPFLG